MRTTVDLSPGLMQAAKLAAAARGISLKELFAKALAREVGAAPTPSVGRVSFPLVGTADAGPLRNITNADIADAFDAEDVERYGR
ncbi:hypothetical protein [Nocardia sp. AG03]|uniref:hypothetical protein n=1 Tax=Nocardia sp. AG03 TaxID=3025312 RepID=UPI002418219C|nr:hypothetical protein [Nocardia sp. AG03]